MNELECRPLTAWGPESMTDARKIFAANLARLVVRQGFSKSGLAGALKVKTQMVSRWLKGETLPSKYLEAIAEYLQVPISSLFSEPTSEVSPVRLKKITPEDAVRVIAGEFGLTVRKIKKTDD